MNENLFAYDAPDLSRQMKSALTGEGGTIDTVGDGEEALFLESTEPNGFVVLDTGLPERDGNSVLKEWRKEQVETPVPKLTARDGWSECVDALDAEVDDYMTKAFHKPELLDVTSVSELKKKLHRQFE